MNLNEDVWRHFKPLVLKKKSVIVLKKKIKIKTVFYGWGRGVN